MIQTDEHKNNCRKDINTINISVFDWFELVLILTT